MTVEQMIQRYDDERNNKESQFDKIRWIRDVEETLFNDVVLTHENEIEEPDKYFDDFGLTSNLIAKVPYTDVYIHYIDMKVNLKLNQIQKYNQASTLFNNALITFQQYYNRTHKPLGSTNWFNHEVL